MNSVSSTLSSRWRRIVLLAAAILGCSFGAISGRAQIFLDAVVTLVPDGVRYDFAVKNTTPEEVVLVSLLDGPLGDPRIAATLDAPSGFLANYDPGLGIVDFLGDTEVFGAGTMLHGFGFETSPGNVMAFRMFEALSIQGTLFRGQVNVTVVPEPGSILAGMVVLGGVVAHLVRRYRPQSSLS